MYFPPPPMIGFSAQITLRPQHLARLVGLQSKHQLALKAAQTLDEDGKLIGYTISPCDPSDPDADVVRSDGSVEESAVEIAALATLTEAICSALKLSSWPDEPGPAPRGYEWHKGLRYEYDVERQVGVITEQWVPWLP